MCVINRLPNKQIYYVPFYVYDIGEITSSGCLNALRLYLSRGYHPAILWYEKKHQWPKHNSH
jgi:hypothetical protein